MTEQAQQEKVNRVNITDEDMFIQCHLEEDGEGREQRVGIKWYTQHNYSQRSLLLQKAGVLKVREKRTLWNHEEGLFNCEEHSSYYTTVRPALPFYVTFNMSRYSGNG